MLDHLHRLLSVDAFDPSSPVCCCVLSAIFYRQQQECGAQKVKDIKIRGWLACSLPLFHFHSRTLNSTLLGGLSLCSPLSFSILSSFLLCFLLLFLLVASLSPCAHCFCLLTSTPRHLDTSTPSAQHPSSASTSITSHIPRHCLLLSFPQTATQQQ